MKNSNMKINVRINAKRLLVLTICVLLVGLLVFCFAACSKRDETNPSNFAKDEEQQVPDNTPSEDETNPTSPTDDNPTVPSDGTPSTPSDNDSTDPNADGNHSEPTQNDPVTFTLEEFANFVINANSLDATSEFNVTFGGRTLAKETREYTRTENGGTIRTNLVSLNSADAKNPYSTQETTETLSKDAFDELFPNFSALINEANFKGGRYELASQDSVTTLTFSIDRTLAKRLLNLTEDEASNISTDISVVISCKNECAERFCATYTSSNGNTVEIKVVYSSKR